MMFRLTTVAAVLAALPFASASQEVKTLGAVTVTATPILPLGAVQTPVASLVAQRAATSDSARLLQDTPGVSLYGAGGVSSLPAIHGLADDRIRIQVDGMDLMAACPNHMNSALSYIDPTRVGSITVFAGITPVSVGGDSLGGTIAVNSAPPEFSDQAENVIAKGVLGTFYRSNGNASGFNVGVTYVGHIVNLTYSGASAKSANTFAGVDFKPAGPGAVGGPWLGANEVGSTHFNTENHDIALALRLDKQLLQLSVGTQNLPFEGFPNQRMDMTGNNNTQINLRYRGQFDWGKLQARYFDQDTQHFMDMGSDRFNYGTGMPMNTTAKTRGAQLQTDYVLSERDVIKAGLESHTYTLYDWWPAVGGVMGPRTFWNVDFGTRDRLGAFAEWEAQWSPQWLSLIGLRTETVKTDAGPVQGYNAQAIWATDAAAFNAQNRQRSDNNFDFTALARYTPADTQSFEAGFARKAHSPNLYQRYPWSTQAMASLMNNFVGDGNAYIGNLNLQPEVAHTVSVSGDWHDAVQTQWGVKATAYVTWVQDFIDAQRCNFGQCGAANLTSTTGFVSLQYVNQSARLQGLDLSGNVLLGSSSNWGSFKGKGVLSYVNGSNTSTGDGLYNIMPLNAKLALEQRIDGWTSTAEVQWVAAKTNVSRVRNEAPTPGYSLLNVRTSFEIKRLRLDFGIENLLNRAYTLPLGGAYLGQGASMTSLGIPWGVGVPGMGRSVNLALSLRF
jgi:iron complex outermembrane receptor protein